nr:PTS sugar transporter subunit IIA [Listeria goaensis]
MLEYASLFQEKNTLMGQIATDQQNFFSLAATILEDGDFVERSFFRAIVEREKVFPTGLEMNDIRIAIPHTDVCHVKKPFVFVSKLEHAIPFVQMGTTDKVIDVQMIFILGIREPQNQVPLLAKIMEKFGEENFSKRLQNLHDKQDMVAFLKKQFGGFEQ